MSMTISRRIYFSAPHDDNVANHHRALHRALAERLVARGYIVEQFARPTGKPGLAAHQSWTRERCDLVARRCVGGVFVGTPRWHLTSESGDHVSFASEYSHYEAGVIETLGLPTLVLREDRVAPRVLFSDTFGGFIVRIPVHAGPEWLDADAHFNEVFHNFCTEVEQRRDVFLGYCSTAGELADAVKEELTKIGATVLDWKADFAPAGTIYDQIVEASRRCSGGVFLFTKDDPIKGQKDQAAPRDNVVFEAGYFAAAKGKDRVLIIREKGSKLPADLGGDIYAPIDKRTDIKSIRETLRLFVEKRL
jgi:CAP12/Pycsar effector protein, TIR domain